ncbi:alpha/beta hydrolase [Mesorhizobium sp. VNQ89]|uniref:alpha/beta hydrolase n=1 Tax=Mesorhizobium quangtriensis TaxID=3157709 RepID=UPI0032B81C2F
MFRLKVFPNMQGSWADFRAPLLRLLHEVVFGLQLLAVGVSLSACASRPGPEILEPVQAHVDGAQIVTVYTATTRAREAPGVTRFTGERARQTNYATFDISLPPGRQPGKIDWPRNRPDPSRTVAVVDQQGLDEREFLARLSASARSTQGEVSLFVHGYNQNFQQALFRLAQMVGDSQQETSSILFAWPSQATVAGYVADRDAVIYSRDYLVEMLAALARDRNVSKINLFAHSMGGLLTVEALRQLRLTGQDRVLDRLQVVLAAPDIDADVFRAQMNVVGPMEMPLIVLVSPDDRALLVSQRLAGQHERVGALDVNDPRVEEAARQANVAFIDISSLDTLDPLNHNRYALVASIYAQLEETGDLNAGQPLRQAGAFVFKSIGSTISSPFVLVGKALAGD